MATVLVTGGAGYVGSHACKALARAGHVPVTYDNLETGHSELVKWGPLECGDLHETDRLTEVMQRYRATAVMHFASLIRVEESVVKPDLYEHNIVNGTRSLLRAMERAGIASIVVSSSCAVYGVPRQVPITEDEPCKPANPYGRAKLQMEGLLKAAEAGGLSWVALRYFNAAGADPDGETGEWHEPETHLIPLVLDAALGLKQIAIYGTDYPTADGTCIRDYIHVSDLADAHILALDYAQRTKRGGAFNLGTGVGSSVRQLIDVARKVTGREFAVAIGPRRDGDTPELVADPTRARSSLGWAPRLSDLETQIAHAWVWHRKLRGGA